VILSICHREISFKKPSMVRNYHLRSPSISSLSASMQEAVELGELRIIVWGLSTSHQKKYNNDGPWPWFLPYCWQARSDVQRSIWRTMFITTAKVTVSEYLTSVWGQVLEPSNQKLEYRGCYDENSLYAHLDNSEHRHLVFWALMIFRQCSMYDRPSCASVIVEPASECG
jgi:hypothetical protein